MQIEVEVIERYNDEYPDYSHVTTYLYEIPYTAGNDFKEMCGEVMEQILRIDSTVGEPEEVNGAFVRFRGNRKTVEVTFFGTQESYGMIHSRIQPFNYIDLLEVDRNLAKKYNRIFSIEIYFIGAKSGIKRVVHREEGKSLEEMKDEIVKFKQTRKDMNPLHEFWSDNMWVWVNVEGTYVAKIYK